MINYYCTFTIELKRYFLFRILTNVTPPEIINFGVEFCDLEGDQILTDNDNNST